VSTNDPGLNPAADGGNLDPDHFDPRLKRALGQAPDRAELPDWRVRRAILDQAHEAVSASEALLAASQKRTGWDALRSWFRGRDDEGRRTRGVPWGAALATAAVAVLATLIWQHEPLPGARPDAEPARPRGMTESRKEGVPEAPPAAPHAAPPAALPTPTEPTAPAAAPAPAAPAADMVATAPPSPPAQPAQPAPTAPPPPTARADASSGPEPSAERPPLSPSQMQRLAQSQSRAAAAAPPPVPSVTAEATAPPQSAEKVEPPASTSAANERAAAAATATAKDSAAAAAAAAGAAPAGAGAGADPAAAAAAAAAAAPPAPAPPPDYSSLARWTELRIAHVSGDVRVISRARAGALVGLLNTAAAQPQGPGEAMRGLAYFRVMLERRGETLALLEVGGNQLRWTEGGSVPVTSRPAPADLAALENALRTALRGSGTPRAPN